MLLLIPPPHTNSLQSTPIIPSPHTSSSLSFVTNNLQEKLNRSSGIYREKGTVDVSAVQMAQFLQQIVCCSRFRHLQPRVSLSFIIPDHLSSSYTKPQMHSEAVICTSFYFLYFSCSYWCSVFMFGRLNADWCLLCRTPLLIPTSYFNSRSHFTSAFYNVSIKLKISTYTSLG